MKLHTIYQWTVCENILVISPYAVSNIKLYVIDELMNSECRRKVHVDGHHSHPKNIIIHSSGNKVLSPWFFKMKYYFNDTGTLEPSELRQYLNGPPLEIEVHDRDRKPEGVKLKPTLFGDDLEDEKISNVGTVASKSLLLHYDIW